MGIKTTRVVKFIRKGDKGDKGPALRGPQAWSNCTTGYAFQAGADDAWKDVVVYGDNYYSCIKSHTKTADNYPGSTEDQNNKYWQLGDKIELVATKILLSTYALVKNLGVECIDMKDASGNVLFQAKDGNVICKTGVFEDITVYGDITADNLNLKISTAYHLGELALPNGSICINVNQLILPEIPDGTARSLRIMNPMISRASPEALTLHPETSKVFITTEASALGAENEDIILQDAGVNGAFYAELVGYSDGNTYWTIPVSNKELIKIESPLW